MPWCRKSLWSEKWASFYSCKKFACNQKLVLSFASFSLVCELWPGRVLRSEIPPSVLGWSVCCLTSGCVVDLLRLQWLGRDADVKLNWSRSRFTRSMHQTATVQPHTSRFRDHWVLRSIPSEFDFLICAKQNMFWEVLHIRSDGVYLPSQSSELCSVQWRIVTVILDGRSAHVHSVNTDLYESTTF